MTYVPGDAAVRAATLAYFATPGIDGIEMWFADEPWFIAGGQWNLKKRNGNNTIAYLHFDSSQEARVAVGGTIAGTPVGQKMVRHNLSIILGYVFAIPANQINSAVKADSWVAPLDTVIGLVIAKIRADPTFGTAAQGDARPIWQAGQGLNGEPDIIVTRDLPVTTPQASRVLNWIRIQVTVLEVVTA